MRIGSVVGVLAVNAVVAALLLPARPATAADDPELKTLEHAYQGEIRRLVQRYCHECHSEKRTEADIDFTAFATWADVRKHPQTWQKVAEMLDNGQMPPKRLASRPMRNGLDSSSGCAAISRSRPKPGPAIPGRSCCAG